MADVRALISLTYDDDGPDKNDANRDWLVNADTKEVIQIREIKDKTLQVAHQLKLHGFGIGQTAHILCPNSIHFHVIVFGVWLLGKST